MPAAKKPNQKIDEAAKVEEAVKLPTFPEWVIGLLIEYDSPAFLQTCVIGMISDLETLKKDDENKHGGYNFVSIDDYYQFVAKHAAEVYGMSWNLTEIDSAVEAVGDKTSIRRTYSVSIFNIYGAEIKEYCKLSVAGPNGGHQTSGIQMSYADKVFMRQAFKIRTGETEADNLPQTTEKAEEFFKNSKDSHEQPFAF